MPNPSESCEGMTFCITCSDAAESLRVEAIAEGGAVGTCVDSLGHRSEVLLGLVPDAVVGRDVLVHAGVALLVHATAASEASR